MTNARVVRIPGYAQGSDLGGEPINWVVYDTETKERHTEWNPRYVPPPPPTELELAQWAVDEAEHELAEAKAYLAELARPKDAN